MGFSKQLVSSMTLAEKVDQMAVRNRAAQMDNLLVQEANPRLGIPPLRQIDGPRGTHLLSQESKSPCFPVPLAVAATWDCELAFAIACDWGQRMRALDIDQLYAPGLNIITDPRCGRNGEYLSEDPVVSGEIAAAMVNGLESQNVLSTIKHYACNSFEAGRFIIDVSVPERVLHEVFLEGFRIVLAKSKPRSVMTAYNSVNGRFCAANQSLLDQLRGWGFDGMVVSDWGANMESAAAAVKAGVHIDMPGYRFYTEEKLQAAVDTDEITMAEIDALVEKLLSLKQALGLFGRETLDDSNQAITANEAANALLPASRKLCRRAGAESCVLLKNENNLLPLKPERIQSLAVIGPFADSDSVIGNQGSSTVWPEYCVTVREGLAKVYSQVEYAPGVDFFSYSGAQPKNDIAFKAEYFNGLEPEGCPVFTREESGIRHARFIGEQAARESGYDTSGIVDINLSAAADEGSGDAAASVLSGIENAADMSVRWIGTFQAERAGKYYFKLRGQDGVRLFIDGTNWIDSWQENHIEGQNHYAWIDLSAGAHAIVVEYRSHRKDGFVSLEYTEPPQEDIFAEARAAAAGKDAAVLCVGVLAKEMQAESADNDFFGLPGWQDELIAAVREVNPNTVVVLHTVGGVDISKWIDSVPALVQAWHQGQEAGNSIADVLSGAVNPSGKLTVTFPRSRDQLPQSVVQTRYSPSVRSVGYRKFDAEKLEPQFAFGFGLSYTRFEYSALRVDGHSVCFDLKNIGSVVGKEVSQVYVAAENSPVERPVRELKGFAKTELVPGETKTVTVTLDAQAFGYYCEQQHAWVDDTGDLEIQVGASSRDIRLRETRTKEGSPK